MAYEDENRGPMFLAVITAGFVLCTIVVLIRFVTRVCIKRNAGYDDLTMFLAWVRSIEFHMHVQDHFR